VASTNWTKDQVKLAFHLYCQLPFGRLHSRNPEIIELAELIGRTPSAVAMKCTNLASLDPVITKSGRTGLGNASALDKEVWDEFNRNWEQLAVECELSLKALRKDKGGVKKLVDSFDEQLFDYTGLTRVATVKQRVGQAFFRRTVLSSYNNKCCMTGLSEPKLLIASHIMPWKTDSKNRLNPRNGLALSALHDKAFDRGLITLSEDFRVTVSSALLSLKNEALIRDAFISIDGKKIAMPEKFWPDFEFLKYHRDVVFQQG
jgi:predicted restriction endonuclease